MKQLYSLILWWGSTPTAYGGSRPGCLMLRGPLCIIRSMQHFEIDRYSFIQHTLQIGISVHVHWIHQSGLLYIGYRLLDIGYWFLLSSCHLRALILHLALAYLTRHISFSNIQLFIFYSLLIYFLCLFILNFSRILGKFEGTGSANGRPYTYLFRRDIVKTKQMTV